MLMFRKFCQLFKEKKVLIMRLEKDFAEPRWSWARGDEPEMKILREAIQSAQVFVFEAQSSEFSRTVHSELKMMKIEDVVMRTEDEVKERLEKQVKHEEATLDVPFQSTWFEAVHPDTQGAVMGNFYVETYDTRTKRTSSELISSGGPLLIYETEPKRYWQFSYNEKIRGEAILCQKVEEDDAKPGYGEHLTTYLRKLQTGLLAHETVDEKVRFQNVHTSPKKQKLDHVKIKTIIRVIAKERKDYCRPLIAKEINWSHRWMVRGHWVTFWKNKETNEIDYSRIGKDRSGEYYVKGHTWRVEHEKGPDEAPLIANKTRIVK